MTVREVIVNAVFLGIFAGAFAGLAARVHQLSVELEGLRDLVKRLTADTAQQLAVMDRRRW